MKANDVFPSKYLKADDLNGDTLVTIKSVTKETMKGKSGADETKPVMHFDEMQKGLVLNKTNWAAIAKLYGDESDDWKGQTITLTVKEVDSFGDVVSAVRVEKPTAKQPEKPADPKVLWASFCREHGLSAADVQQALGAEKVSAWLAAEEGRTLEQAMQVSLAWIETQNPF